MSEIEERIQALKKEKDAVLLAHYYVPDDVQAAADFIGDSYFLAKKATEISQKVICFAGVTFMGESAKILNPEKTVLLPEPHAGCPMADMADVETIEKMRKEYDDLAVVCYVNSTAELKAHSDVCVTSSNALKIVSRLKEKNIFFIPDENLGRYISEKLPEKHFIFNDGFCHVHTSITKENVLKAKAAKPGIQVLAHPECKKEVLDEADYIGSTSGIIKYATESPDKAFLICTELGVLYELKQKNPGKQFYSVGHRQFCPNMKSVTLEKVADCLENMSGVVEIDEELRLKANKPLERMLELAQ